MNIKTFRKGIFLCVISVVTFIMYTYISNIKMYISIKNMKLSDNRVIRAFDVNEKEYDKVISKYVQVTGEKNLYKYRLRNKRMNELNKELRGCMKDKLIKQVISNKRDEDEKNKNLHRNITYLMYCNNWFSKQIGKICVRQLNIDTYIENIVDSVYKDVEYYPVVQLKDNEGGFSYSNSWFSDRKYGGDRKHEGTDIMYTENKEDIVPIVSISDGTIIKKGWLELGGYRLLIRANKKVSFYYAHLSSYAYGLEEGMKVKAGQLIGYMGSTGYGKEGTKDKFDVHLHMGIYYKNGSEEIGLNPYFLLKMLNFNKLYYN